MADDLSKLLNSVLQQLGVPETHRSMLIGVVESVVDGSGNSVRERAEEIWRRSTDKVAADAEAEQHSTAADRKIDVWEQGYGKGYAAGIRESGHRGVATADVKGYPLSEGDHVMKVSGDYTFPGDIVAIFKKVDDETVRVVVESTSEDTRGMLHVFNPAQLQKMWPFDLS